MSVILNSEHEIQLYELCKMVTESAVALDVDVKRLTLLLEGAYIETVQEKMPSEPLKSLCSAKGDAPIKMSSKKALEVRRTCRELNKAAKILHWEPIVRQALYDKKLTTAQVVNQAYELYNEQAITQRDDAQEQEESVVQVSEDFGSATHQPDVPADEIKEALKSLQEKGFVTWSDRKWSAQSKVTHEQRQMSPQMTFAYNIRRIVTLAVLCLNRKLFPQSNRQDDDLYQLQDQCGLRSYKLIVDKKDYDTLHRYWDTHIFPMIEIMARLNNARAREARAMKRAKPESVTVEVGWMWFPMNSSH